MNVSTDIITIVSTVNECFHSIEFQQKFNETTANAIINYKTTFPSFDLYKEFN